MAWLAVLGMGLVLGALGGGGGILTVPILVGLFGMAATQATGASLFIVGATSVAGAALGAWKGETENKAALSLAIPSAAGAFAARMWVMPAIPDPLFGLPKDKVLLWTFAALMIVVGIRMLTPQPERAEGDYPEPALPLVAAVGLGIGLVSGILGAGGGFLIVPALTLLLGIELKRAIPTSLLVIAIQSLIGFAGELGRPIPWALLGSAAAVALAGLAAGLAVREKAPKRALQTAFAILVFAVALWMVLR